MTKIAGYVVSGINGYPALRIVGYPVDRISGKLSIRCIPSQKGVLFLFIFQLHVNFLIWLTKCTHLVFFVILVDLLDVGGMFEFLLRLAC